jgi:hypothetical protein
MLFDHYGWIAEWHYIGLETYVPGISSYKRIVSRRFITANGGHLVSNDDRAGARTGITVCAPAVHIVGCGRTQHWRATDNLSFFDFTGDPKSDEQSDVALHTRGFRNGRIDGQGGISYGRKADAGGGLRECGDGEREEKKRNSHAKSVSLQKSVLVDLLRVVEGLLRGPKR